MYHKRGSSDLKYYAMAYLKILLLLPLRVLRATLRALWKAAGALRKAASEGGMGPGGR